MHWEEPRIAAVLVYFWRTKDRNQHKWNICFHIVNLICCNILNDSTLQYNDVSISDKETAPVEILRNLLLFMAFT